MPEPARQVSNGLRARRRPLPFITARIITDEISSPTPQTLRIPEPLSGLADQALPTPTTTALRRRPSLGGRRSGSNPAMAGTSGTFSIPISLGLLAL